MNAETRILEPGEIEPPTAQIRFLFLADQDLFRLRAERLRFLAKGHSLGDYLNFLSLLADAQQEALNHLSAPPLPEPNEQALCREHGMPLLSASSMPLNPLWRKGLTMILQQMEEADLPLAARETITSLTQRDKTGLDEMAGRIMREELADVSPAELPFVAAALQVSFVRMASALGECSFGQLEQGGLCPVCGSHPVASIVHSDGLRYLCCSLCFSQWHLVRVKCSSCESTRGITLYALEGSNGAVTAECCDACNSYLKLLYLEKDSQVEAIADDLASLALDLLLEREGRLRAGPNLLFHPGTA